MGKTIVKHEDVDKLYHAIIDSEKAYLDMSEDEFQTVVEEIFGVTLPIESDTEKENK